MKKNIKLITVLICIFIMQTFIGCYETYSQPTKYKLGTQSQITNYISDNFDRYKDRIKEESGFDGKIIGEEVNDKEQKYIEFDIDAITKIKFGVSGGEVRITKQLSKLSEPNVPNPIKELKLLIVGMETDAYVDATLTYKDDSFISCEYKANDFENPQSRARGEEEKLDANIKSAVSKEELEDLTAKAHSIYNVFEEICKEYNKK